MAEMLFQLRVFAVNSTKPAGPCKNRMALRYNLPR